VANTLQANSTGTLSTNATRFYSNLSAATSVSAFDQLSGEGTAAAQGAAFGLGGLFINALAQAPGFGPAGSDAGPLGYASAEKPAHPAFKALKPDAEVARRWQVWGSGFGVTRRTGGAADTGTANINQRGGGAVLGLTYTVDADRIVGVAVGASGSHFDVPDRSTNGDLTAGHFGLYGLQRFGAVYLNGALAYARIRNETTRTIVGVGPAETAKGSFDSDLFSGRLEVGYAHAFTGYTPTPFAAIAFSRLWQRGYSETSTAFDGTPGILGLTYQAQKVSSLPVSLGTQVDTAWALANGRVIRPYARAAWVHEFKPDTRVDASFITIPRTAFTVAGARAARDALKVDAGVRLPIDASAAFVASGTGEFAGRSYVLAGTGKLTFSW